MAFDQSIPPQANRKLAETAVARTHAWLTRCIAALPRSASPALFGIIQGGQYPDLLRQSAEFVVSQRLPGIAVGGAVIGQDPHQTAETIATIRDLLPKELPLYAMGVGVRPSDLVSVIQAGADMFDCVAPTRLARTGLLYHPDISKERINISQAKFKLDKQPIFSGCDCSTCANYSRGYLHHLFKSHELLYYRLASIHNLRVMIKTVNQLASTSSPSSA
jgi:queuine tRNA-ribosyltransferase